MAGSQQPGDRFDAFEDEALARRAQAAEDAAAGALAERFRGRLVHFLWGRVRSRVDAEDLAQETLTRAFDKLDRYDPQQPFATWLFTIAARLAIDHGRRHGRHRASFPLSAAGERASGEEPGEQAAEREWRQNLWALAAQVLSREQYTGLWLQHGEQFDLKRIAEILGRKPGHMRVILLRARRTLARHLNRDGTPISQTPVNAGGEATSADRPDPPRGMEIRE